MAAEAKQRGKGAGVVRCGWGRHWHLCVRTEQREQRALLGIDERERERIISVVISMSGALEGTTLVPDACPSLPRVCESLRE